jgi:hypothetical protein
MLGDCLEKLQSLSKTMLPLSPSGIRGFLDGCPVKKLVGKILGTKMPPRVFLGSAFDAGITHWLLGGEETELESAINLTLNEIDKFDFIPAQGKALCEEAYRLVLLAIESGKLPKSTEKIQYWIHLRSGPEKHHVLRGKIDFLEKGPGGYILWDAKCTTDPVVKSVGKYKTQLMIYAAALIDEGYPIKMIGLWQANPKERKIILATEPLYDSEVDRVKAMCASIADVYQNGRLWIPAKGSACSNYVCDNFGKCPFGAGRAKDFMAAASKYEEELKNATQKIEV